MEAALPISAALTQGASVDRLRPHAVAYLASRAPSQASPPLNAPRMKPAINLSFNGNCAQAIRFYERVLQAKILFELTWGESPLSKDAPPEWSRKICHSTFTLGELTFHGVDVPPGSYEPPRGFSIILDVDDIDDAERVFRLLGEGGQVLVAQQETFWARRYGKLVDQFGIAWEVNCSRAAQ
jgi:PhnB protein